MSKTINASMRVSYFTVSARVITRWSWRGVAYLLLTALAATMLIPFLWMLSTAIKPEPEIFRFPPVWIPSDWKWENFARAMQAAPFGIYFINTVIYAVSTTLLQLSLCSMAAYAFARLEFKGRDVLFLAVLATMMVPGQVTMIPVFIILKSMPLAGGNDLFGQGGTGWLNTYWGLIIPGAVGAFGIFLLRQFFLSVPRELEDAAKIDGAGNVTIFTRVVLPLSKPALATLAIFTFTATWNEFLWPLLVTSKESMKTLQIGLEVFKGQYATKWDLLMAGSVLVTLPVIIVFLLGQRYFTQGIAVTGLKG